MPSVTWTIAIKTVSEANSSEHWATKAKRHKQQQFFIRQLFMHEKTILKPPCCVKMTRLGGRQLDAEDNLPMAFKFIRDEISECLCPEKRKSYIDKKGKVRQLKGRADDDPRIKWTYHQEKAKRLGVRIEIETQLPGIDHEETE